MNTPDYKTSIAIVGMAGRFPDASTPEAFFQNLVDSVRSLHEWSTEELAERGVPAQTLADPNYVRVGTVIDGCEDFDAAFFGYPPREAEVMDPQQRLLLECAWEALERAAYVPETFPGLIGVFAGSSPSTYIEAIETRPDIIAALGKLQVGIHNDADALASTLAYKLNLRGPSVVVQTFCSTSLVAVHMACQSLIMYESDLALAGGVALTFPHGVGYMYEEGGILSPDGHCRTFDEQGQGSVMGNGVGMVVLKRMEEALADGDHIYAVIRGSAVNNDGQRRVGYTAPGLNGQSAVITQALRNANVKSDTIDYLEAHGTATPLGDSIELAAIIKAFRRGSKRKQFCTLGSVKPNIGHLDRASGVTGLIKTALALTNEYLPPNLDFERANPDIDLANSPFKVNTALTPWPRTTTPRRAGVNSFGLGGTNAHVVLEEAPLLDPTAASRPAHLLVLSARTAAALDAATLRLRDAFVAQPDLALADAAYTLQVGRTEFNHRRALVVRDTADAITILGGTNAAAMRSSEQARRERGVAFVLGGVGDLYTGLAHELYEHEPAFRASTDECCALFAPVLGQDLRALIWPTDGTAASIIDPLAALLGRATASPADTALQSTAVAQPAVFVIEYALAKLLASWGIAPTAMLGYSLGEYVAATLAGVLSLEDAVRLVATRARLIDALPSGAMLAVALNEQDVQPYLGDGIELAAVNGPLASVLAGTPDTIAALVQRLERDEVACRTVPTTHAFHTSMLQPVADQLTALARTIMLNAPTVPYISNVTGTWITPEQATDPTYWARHMTQTVRFADGIAAVLESGAVVVEIGAGQGLSSFIKQHPNCDRARWDEVIATLPGVLERSTDALQSAFTAFGRLWLAGVTVNWQGFNAHEQRRRVPLPTYPFERQRFWIEPRLVAHVERSTPDDGKRPDIGDWLYVPAWRRSFVRDTTPVSAHANWLVFAEPDGIGMDLAARLAADGGSVVTVIPGDDFARQPTGVWTIRPDEPDDYMRLLRLLDTLPTSILHGWTVGEDADQSFDRAQERGLYSLMYLVRAINRRTTDDVALWLLTRGAQNVTGVEALRPTFGTLAGARLAIAQEHSNISVRQLDVEPPAGPAWQTQRTLDLVRDELAHPTPDLDIAYRGNQRWVLRYENITTDAPTATPFRREGRYLITGGLGAIGMALAEHLGSTVQARLVLTTRTPFPPRAEWTHLVAAPDTPTAQRTTIERLLAVEAMGASVLVVAANVASEEQMRNVVAQADAVYGGLDGVIYAAGTSQSNGFKAVEEITRAGCELHFDAKVHGLYVLEQVLLDRTLDFCVVFSSLASVLGGLGFFGYSAANSFIDAFVQHHNRWHPQPWVAVNWDTWNVRDLDHGDLGATVLGYAMTRDEAISTFERIVAIGAQTSQIVNSTGNLDYRLDQWVRHVTVADDPPDDATVYPRPSLSTTFEPPTNETEELIAAAWQSILGLEVGIHDNFMEIGGNSLIGTQLVTRLRRTFQTNVPLVLIFDAPTVAAMALAIEELLIAEIEALDEMEVEQLTRIHQGA